MIVEQWNFLLPWIVSPQNSYADDIRRETFRISLGHEDGVLVKGISIYIYIYVLHSQRECEYVKRWLSCKLTFHQALNSACPLK